MSLPPSLGRRNDEEPPDPIDVHVGKRIRLRRLMCGLTLEQVGARLDLTYQQVYKYETAQNRVSASRLYELAIVFEVAPSYFFEGLSGSARSEHSLCVEPMEEDEGQASDAEVRQLLRLFSRIPHDGLRKSLLAAVRSIADAQDEGTQ
jgi:transcriptional regulator with XRE-family HTH domain